MSKRLKIQALPLYVTNLLARLLSFSITGPMTWSSRRLARNYKVACVMGFPASHSLSPALHTYWLKQYGIWGCYDAHNVRPQALARMLRRMPKLGWRGCNLTVPHKEAALGIMDALDESAKAIGAVNTVVVRPDGSLHGSNTDAFGFVENIREALAGNPFPMGPATVLGAGGSARAVCYALLGEGVREIRLVNRTRKKAEALAEMDPRIHVVSWGERESTLEGVSLLVNTTTLGMAGKEPLELRLDALPYDAIVNDIVYTPLETELLKMARARGNKTVDGLGMLLHQARPGFAAWFGPLKDDLPEVTPELRAHLLSLAGAA